MNSLITGIIGFVGSHMADLLVEKGHKVYGISRDIKSDQNIAHLKGKIHVVQVDILDKKALEKLIAKVKPKYIFHFAAQSSNLDSFKKPQFTLKTNILGTTNLFEAVRQAKFDPAIVIAGSSEEYGLVKKDELPIKETNPLRPQNPYAVSKLAADYLGYQYFKSHGLKIVRIRPFNTEGPRRQDRYVTSNFAKQTALIEKGKQKPVILVGNLDARRDFTDVRDVVLGYYLAARKGTPGEVYNICSGKARKIEEVLKMLISLSKVKKIKVQKDPKRMRPSEIPVFVGDNSKFVKATGWRPKIDFNKTLADTLNYWRERV